MQNLYARLSANGKQNFTFSASIFFLPPVPYPRGFIFLKCSNRDHIVDHRLL